jgi:hypothetical protein
MFRKVTLLVATSLLVVACATEGDGDAVQVRTGDAAVGALQAAPDAIADAGTGKLKMIMEMTVLGETVELVATGAYDTDAQQMSMSMDMGAMFEQLAASTGEEIPVELGDGAMEMVADGDTIYIRSSLFEMFAGTTDWLSMSAEDLGADAETLGLGATTSDPTKILESLRGVTGEPEVVGQEDVHGVATTHYRATMSLADAVAQVPQARRAEVEAALEQLGEVGDAEMPVDVWIDGDDLPRRMTLDMGAAFGAIAGEDAGATMTIELFDYGQPVDIEIPSPDEVTPFREVMDGLGDLGEAS